MKKPDLANLKSDVDKLDIDKFKNLPTNLNNFKGKVDKLDVDKLIHIHVGLTKLSGVIKNDVFKKDACMAKNKSIDDQILYSTNLATKTSLNA